MISLKAISTGQRRTDVLLILLLVLLLPLGAHDWRAGIINDGAGDEFVSSFTSALEMGGSVLSEKSMLERAETSLEKEQTFKTDSEKASAARSEKEWKSSAKKTEETPWKVVPVVIGDVPAEDLGFLKSGDVWALNYWMRANDLDELFILEGEMRDGLEEVAVIRNGMEEMLFLTGHEFRARDEKRMLEYFLAEYREEPVWLLSVKGNVSADITVNGEKAETLGSYVVLPAETAEITVSRPLYGTETHTVDVRESAVLEYHLDANEGESVFISSIPYTDDITYNGEKALGGYLPTPTLPFTVSVKKDGYESSVLSSPVSTGLLEPVLFPSELRDEDRLLEARDRFYTDLILTLSGFGLGVVSTVADSLTETDLTGLETFSYGISIFQLIRTLDSLFEYKDAMRFGL